VVKIRLRSATPERARPIIGPLFTKRNHMAKSHQTFQKREREKKRLEHNQGKREKLQNRNKRDGNSLDDMIAYLDENGNIVDTPPNFSRN
jgi:hypothetical protein